MQTLSQIGHGTWSHFSFGDPAGSFKIDKGFYGEAEARRRHMTRAEKSGELWQHPEAMLRASQTLPESAAELTKAAAPVVPAFKPVAAMPAARVTYQPQEQPDAATAQADALRSQPRSHREPFVPPTPPAPSSNMGLAAACTAASPKHNSPLASSPEPGLQVPQSPCSGGGLAASATVAGPQPREPPIALPDPQLNQLRNGKDPPVISVPDSLDAAMALNGPSMRPPVPQLPQLWAQQPRYMTPTSALSAASTARSGSVTPASMPGGPKIRFEERLGGTSVQLPLRRADSDPGLQKSYIDPRMKLRPTPEGSAAGSQRGDGISAASRYTGTLSFS